MLQGGDEKSIDTLVNDYIMEYSEKKSATQTERLIKNVIRDDPEKAWEIILKLIEFAPNEDILVKIGVGPLEDLLAYHSNEFIERVEMETRDNEKFVTTLEYVWKRNMTEEVWQRIQKAIQEQWKDDIINMQELFRNNEYDIGEENGIIGPKTDQAIKRLRDKTRTPLESLEEIIEELRKKA